MDDVENESQVGATFFSFFRASFAISTEACKLIRAQVLITENDMVAYVLRLGLGLAIIVHVLVAFTFRLHTR